MAHCACRMRHRFMLEFSVENDGLHWARTRLAFPMPTVLPFVLNYRNCDDFLFFIRPWRAHTDNVVIRTEASRSSGLVIERGFHFICATDLFF